MVSGQTTKYASAKLIRFLHSYLTDPLASSVRGTITFGDGTGSNPKPDTIATTGTLSIGAITDLNYWLSTGNPTIIVDTTTKTKDTDYTYDSTKAEITWLKSQSVTTSVTAQYTAKKHWIHEDYPQNFNEAYYPKIMVAPISIVRDDISLGQMYSAGTGKGERYIITYDIQVFVKRGVPGTVDSVTYRDDDLVDTIVDEVMEVLFKYRAQAPLNIFEDIKILNGSPIRSNEQHGIYGYSLAVQVKYNKIYA